MDPPVFVWAAGEIADATGGHLFQQFGVTREGKVDGYEHPPRAVRRRAPTLFGVGVLEQAVLPAGAGRFGWKARYPSVEAAVAGALAGEMGLTSKRFPDGHGHIELSEVQLTALAAFVRSLPPPAPDPRISSQGEGKRVFVDVGCATCHVPHLQLDQSRGTRQPAPAYTDLRLHDLGPALADGLSEGHASGTQFRTPPLWGIRHATSGFLHDGRAVTIRDSILAHAGEANAVIARYRALDPVQSAALLAFVSSL